MPSIEEQPTTFKGFPPRARPGKSLAVHRMYIPLLALAILVAGCVTPPPIGPIAPGAPGAPGSSSWSLDCGLSNWDETCNARASPNDSPSKTEIDIAVNPTDPRNVFVASKDLDPLASDCVWSVGQVTKDAGRTWTTVYVGGTLEERQAPTHPLFGYACVTDPILAFDSAGTLYYPLQAYAFAPGPISGQPLPAGGGSAFFMAISRDGGATFPDIVPMALAEGNLVFHDYPRMAVSPTTDSVSTAWNAVGAAGINPYVVTVRNGQVDQRPAVVAFPDEPRSTAFRSGYAAGSDGTYFMTVSKARVVATPEPLPQPEGIAYLAISDDDARTFGTFKPMFQEVGIPSPLPNSEFRTFTALELAIDNSGGARDGRLYAAWADYARNNSDILVAWTDDRGDSWDKPVLVTDNANDQFMVRAAVSADGALHLLYMDRQHDPGNKLIDFTHSWSEDGGATWRHARLTTRSFDGDLGVHQNDFPFIGDYNGIATVGDHVWFGFPTTQTGVAEIAVAHAVRGNATA